MRKFILGMVLLSLGTSAFANCRYEYEDAITKRDLRNLYVVYGVTIATVAAGGLLPVLAYQSIGTAGYLAIGALSVDAALTDVDFHKNSFEKVQEALLASDKAINNGSPAESKQLNRIVKRVAKKIGQEQSEELKLEIMQLLAEGYNDETFCPIVKIRKNGNEKRAVFNRASLIKYLSMKLEQKI